MAPQARSQRDWTVARCNRLMRPLVTRIQKLRMLKEDKEILRRPTTVKGRESSEESDDDTRTNSRKETDPDWMSVSKKKSMKTAKAYHSSKAVKAQWAALAGIGIRTPARKTHTNFQPGELSIPTPYLARSSSDMSEAGNNSSSPLLSSTMFNRGKNGSNLIKSVADLPNIPKKVYLAEGEDEEAVASNVVKLFIDILNSTKESVDTEEQKRSSPTQGTRSLWATCCAKFGIAIGEAEMDPDPEEDGLLDAGAEYYGMAEDLDLPVRKPGGQLHLRLIVRAHATHVMVSAVKEGLVTFNVLQQFIPYMLRKDSSIALEGELLLTKSLANMTSKTHGLTCPSKHRNMFYTHIVNSVVTQVACADEVHRLAIAFRQYDSLLRHPEFPVEWLATRALLPTWRDVFRTLLDSKSLREIQDAYKLLLNTISVAVGLRPSSAAANKVLVEVPADFAAGDRCFKCPRAASGTFLVNNFLRLGANDGKSSKSQLADALSTTLSSMSTMLSSFSIAHHANPVDLVNINAQVILSALNMLSAEIASYHAQNFLSTNTTDTKHAKVMARRSISILAATMLPRLTGCQLANGSGFVSVDKLVQLMKKLDAGTRNGAADLATILDCLPELICSIARGVSQILNVDPFDIFRNIVHSLASPNIVEQKISPSTALFLKQLAFSSAHLFAEVSKDRAHYSLIDELEKEIGQSEHFDVSNTPFRSSTKAQTESRGFKWEEGICEWVLASPKTKPKANGLPQSTVDTPKKPGRMLDLFNQATKDDPSDDDLPDSGLWTTEVGSSNIDHLCDLINSSSPISGGVLYILPPTDNFDKTMFRRKKVEKKGSTLPDMRSESHRVKKMKVTDLKLPMLKRPKRAPAYDSDASDDELSFHGPQSRKRLSSPNLRSSLSSAGPSGFNSRSKFPRNAPKDDSEDELGFA
jgi:hypothetical protein